MIKNIVFDVGQVLMSYTPENYLKNLGFSEKTVQTLRKAIFESTLWEDNFNGRNLGRLSEKCTGIKKRSADGI